MATIPNRYAQLTGLMPKGQFWDALGAVIPKRNTPYQFLFETGIPNRRFGVFDNDAFQYVVITDALGQAIVTLDLGIGEHTIRIEDDVLVTRNGCEILTSGVPKRPEEIEALMAESL